MIELWIGIDPGKTTGLALWDVVHQRFINVTSGDFFQIQDEILKVQRTGAYRIVGAAIENPNLNQPVFMRPDLKQKFQLAVAAGDQEEADSCLRQHSRQAQNVGMNKRDASLYIEWIQRQSIRVLEIRPWRRKVSTGTEFNKMTGYDKRTNQHGRDAALLIYKFAKENS